MRSRNRDLILIFVALGWIVAILGLYYYRHKPVTPELALSLVQVGWRVIASFGIVSLGCGVGMRFLRFQVQPQVGLLALAAGIGIGSLGIGFYICVQLFGVNPLAAWISFILLWMIFWRDALRYWQHVWAMLRDVPLSSALVRIIAALIALLFLVALVSASTPPIKFDALVYHLALPGNYILNGSAAYISENMFWGMPQITESLYTWAMLLAGSSAGTMLSWAIGLIAVFGLLDFLQQTFGARPAWVGLGSLLAGFTLVQGLSWAYVEWMLILAGIATLAALANFVEETDARWAVLSGCLAGIAFGVKYTGMAIGLPVGIFLFVYAWKRFNLRAASKLFAIYSITVLVFVLPWMLKNVVATGNPMYPFLFASGAMSADRLALYQGVAVELSWLDSLLLPIQATVKGIEGGAGFSASLGPLLLGLGSLAWIPNENRRSETASRLSIAFWMALGGIIIWAVASRLSGLLAQARLYAVFFPAFAVLAAGGFESLEGLKLPGVRIGRVAGSLILLVVGLNLFQTGVASIRSGAWQYLLGALSQDAYLERNLGWYAAAMESVRSLPEGSRTLMLWEPRGYYCMPGCDSDEVIDRWRYEYLRYQNEGAILDAWLEQGNTHLLLHRAGADFIRENDDRYSRDEWMALDRLVSALPVEAEFGGVYTLYRLSP